MNSLALFNLHWAAATGARAVIVVEGFFDGFAVYQAGYPTVVALMGSTLSPRQAELLVSHFDRATLSPDGDEAGRQGSAMVGGVLAALMPLHTISLQDGVQPDGLAPGRNTTSRAELRRRIEHMCCRPSRALGRSSRSSS